jgi:hypothetical protein
MRIKTNMNKIDRNKSIEELEENVWPEQDFNSHLVAQCHALRKKALKALTTEDIRLMVGQNIGLNYLIPEAINKLRENALTAGDYYEGDLLETVLNINNNFWNINSELSNQLNDIVNNINLNKIEQLELIEAIRQFKKK